MSLDSIRETHALAFVIDRMWAQGDDDQNLNTFLQEACDIEERAIPNSVAVKLLELVHKYKLERLQAPTEDDGEDLFAEMASQAKATRGETLAALRDDKVS